MPKDLAKASPRSRALGMVYLFYFLAAIGSVLLSGRGYHELGTIVNIMSTALYVVVVVMFYALLRVFHKTLALLAAACGIVGCIITGLSTFHLSTPISPLWFFGCFCILIGYSILTSAFVPRVLGLLMILAGIGWLVTLLPPFLAFALYTKVLGFLAELFLMLWLLILGVPCAPESRKAT